MRKYFLKILVFAALASIPNCLTLIAIADNLNSSNETWLLKITDIRVPSGNDQGIVRFEDEYYRRGYYKPKHPRVRFVYVVLSLTNKTGMMQSFDFKKMLIHGPSGLKLAPVLFMKRGEERYQKLKPLAEIKPGETITRDIIFTFPKKIRPLKLIYPGLPDMIIPDKNPEKEKEVRF